MENQFTIFDASAGSGKTYTLVKKYLILLLTTPGNESFRNILAITFTNKAVSEMKSRILESLQVLAREDKSAKDQDFLEDILQSVSLSEAQVKQKSRKLLKQIIHNYASFEVSTIDGFTHRVLRTFAKDLELPLNFEVALNTEDILKEAVDRLLAKAGEDPQLTRVLVDYTLGKTDEDKSWDIGLDLFEISKLLTAETSAPFVRLLQDRNLEDFQNYAKILSNHRKELENTLTSLGRTFFELLKDHELEAEHFTRKSCPKFFDQLLLGKIPENVEQSWLRNIATDKLYPKKTPPAKQNILDKIQPEISDACTRARELILQIQFIQAVEKELVPLSLLSEIQNQVSEIKQENAMVLISDFNATIAATVREQPVPFIYERLGERYQHYFIDEFQDTSELQWNNLIPLIGHNLESEHQNGFFSSLTLVGDAKQSIYRWRGGKAEQFMELCARQHPFTVERPEVLVLPKNYRSARTIVDFNNRFFHFASSCFENEQHRRLYQKSEQEEVSRSEGYVNLSFIQAENKEEEMELFPDKVLTTILALREKEVALSDICILTRTKKEGFAIANRLSEHGLPIISAESLLVSRSPEVRFINAVLEYSLEPGEKSLRYEILRYLLDTRLKTEEEFKFLSEGLDREGSSFFDFLRGHGFELDPEVLHRISVYEAAEYVIRAFRLAEKPDAYLQFFLDFVFESAHSKGAGIFEYLELWEQKKDDLSIVVPEGVNAVQLLTIHKAKGLEFPIVIYPFANDLIRNVRNEKLWLRLPFQVPDSIPVANLRAAERMLSWGDEAASKFRELCCNSQLDTLNVLYVAMTRAEKQLFVISSLDLNSDGNEKENTVSGLLISYLKQKGLWTGSLDYHFGDPLDLPPTEKEPTSVPYQEGFYSSPTDRRGINLITRAGLIWDSERKEAIEKGQLIHDLFAGVYTEEDVPSVMQHALEKGVLRDAEASEIETSIRQVINHPSLKEFYSKDYTCHTEQAMISADGDVLRPDRICIKGKTATVIDYKTGVPRAQHELQVSTYSDLLQEMGYDRGQNLLVYINRSISVKVV